MISNSISHHALFGGYRRDLPFSLASRSAIVLFSFFNAEILFVKGANPFGTHYIQEFYFLFLIIYSLFYFARRGLAVKRMDIFVFIYPLLFTSLSAIFSLFEYGQPLFYGYFEARVTFLSFVYFPLKDLIRGDKRRLIFLLNSTVYLTFFVTILGLLLKIGVFSVADYYGFGTSDFSVRGDLESSSVVRGDRLATGRFVVIFATLYALTMAIESSRRIWIVAAFALLWHIVFVLQERQTMVGVAVALLLLLLPGLHLRRVRVGAVMILLTGVGLAFLLSFRTDLIAAQLVLLEDTISADYRTEPRLETALTMMQNMKLFFGHGALSLLWQGGFHSIYSPRFFIGDVGVIGTAFRLGLIPSLILLGIAINFLVKRTRQLPLLGVRKLIWAMLAYMAATAVTSAPFEYLGNFLALMFLIMDTASSHKTSNTQLKRTVNRSRIELTPLQAHRDLII